MDIDLGKINIVEAIKILEKELEKRNPPSYVWTMKNGEKINLKDMSNEHIKNVIKLLHKNFELEEAYADYPY